MLEIEQASRLIGALSELAARDAREAFEESLAVADIRPSCPHGMP